LTRKERTINYKTILGAGILETGGLAGCSTSTVDTHQAGGIPTPNISTTNSIPNVKVGDQVRRRGCANESLKLFFIGTYGNAGICAVDRAEVATAYKALSSGTPVNGDIAPLPWLGSGTEPYFLQTLSQ
jgi:hypothetical protein